jgi:hypothetical protein
MEMKRFLFPALVLCSALASACQSPASNDNNVNRGANQNAANINQTLGVNTNTNSLTRDPKNKAALITIYRDAAKNIKIAVAPSTIRLVKNKGQKLRFYVFNNLDEDVKDVKIEFKSGDPMDGSYSIGAVPSGTDVKSNSQGIKVGQADGTYKYTITVTVDGVATPIVLDPDVEVATAD